MVADVVVRVRSMSVTTGITNGALVCLRWSRWFEETVPLFLRDYYRQGGILCLVGMYSRMGVLLMCEALGRRIRGLNIEPLAEPAEAVAQCSRGSPSADSIT